MKRFTKLLILAFAVVTVLAVTAVSASATDLKIGIGIVDASGLRLRSGPDTESTIISTASYGDKVVVLADYGDWYFVNYNLNVGYMKAEYLQFLDRENVYLGNGRVNSYVNFRTGPSTDNETITQLPPDTIVNIIGLNCTWYKVTWEGYTGYIRSDLVDLTEVPYYNTNTGSIYDTYSSSSSGSSSSGGSTESYTETYEEPAPTYSTAGEQVAAFAQTLQGIPYVWGGTTTGGFDCSGFVQYVYRQFGISLNRTANSQMSNGYYISSSDLIPGDLVFFSGTYATSGASHVGIYIGNGQFVHASSGRGYVTISDLWSSYYSSHYYGARRIY